ncbi:MAG: LacI family transcriptional regulator [Gaiellaceae bacterium]|nr:LacI family transcriptional regulator [Gaiellaceae bacterium]
MSERNVEIVADSPERAAGRPTMSDVARAAGVSLKTVSRVVNDEPGVRLDTAHRVQEAIETLGFRRNDAARALRSGQVSRTLGLVIEDISNPFYSGIMRGVEQVAREHGRLLIAGSSDETPERERELVLALCERRVDGLIIVPASNDHAYLLPEMRLGVHVVFLDRPPVGITADTVLLDNQGGADAATEHLVAQGHRRVAMVGDTPTLFTASERLAGYRRALERHGLPFDEQLVRLGLHDADAAARAASELLALPDPPTAIFAANNRNTIGALRAIAAVERAIALVGFDDIELAELLAVPVTVVAGSPLDLGEQAANLLIERLQGSQAPHRTIVLPTTLVPRGSGEVGP